MSIEELRKWNTIDGSTINEGQLLVLQKQKKITVNEIVKVPKPKTEELSNSLTENSVNTDKNNK